MNFKINETAEKLRGGYYTPAPIADFLTHWALIHHPQHILEPSCGDGRFLEAIYRQVEAGHSLAPAFVDAVELIPDEADKANQFGDKLRQLATEVEIIKADFFSWISTVNGNQWEAIVGNPPYIRYQYFDKEQRDKAKQIFTQANVPFTKHTNAWVPFVIASVMHLAPHGRLAMVVPAELLHIQHADGIRLLLEQEMESVTLIHFRQLVFQEALQGIVLLLATKRARGFTPLNFNHSTTNLQIIDLNDLPDLLSLNLIASPQQSTLAYQGDWMTALLNSEEIALLSRLKENTAILPFVAMANVTLGIVTGANDFFVATDEVMKRYHLESIAAPMLAKSNLIKGITYTRQDHESNLTDGKAVHFLSFPNKPMSELPPLMVEYLKEGEAQALPTRYKCRIRTPWYVVPYVWKAEVALLKRCHHFPRLVLNDLGAYSTDTAYRVRMKPEYHDQARNFVFSFLNSLTFLYAELLGRHYGGGVLELVPSEIARLPIPLVEVNDEQFSKVDQMIRQGVEWPILLDYTDAIILKAGLGLTEAEIITIKKAHQKLMRRRLRIATT